MKFKLLILSLLALSLSACGSKRLKSSQTKEDITRPPAIAVSEDSSLGIPTDSNETVSYEEWLKKNSAETPTPTGALE